MKRLLIMFAGLVLATTAQAASFDCAKAGTKVEKLICGDAELSKLDEELNTAYKTALQDKQQADTVRQAQKQWMKERNGCADVGCVKGAYEGRLISLKTTHVLSDDNVAAKQKVTGAANMDVNATEKKFPPYPDVWEMQFPLLENKQLPALRNAWLNNGDLWLGFVSQKRTERTLLQGIPINEFTGITFFGRKNIVFNKSGEEAKLDDGSIVRTVKQAPGVNYFPNKAVLKDGSYVSSVSGDFYRGCYQGPAGNTLTRYKSKATRDQLQPSKVVFLLLDEPFTFPTGSVDGPNRSAACDAAEQQVTTRVVSLEGEILPLEDGGFLLLDTGYGWVIRFDANLNTHTKLLNKKLFVLDSEISGATKFIEKITGKNYMDKHGWTKMQEVVDDLNAYLIKLSKGEK